MHGPALSAIPTRGQGRTSPSVRAELAKHRFVFYLRAEKQDGTDKLTNGWQAHAHRSGSTSRAKARCGSAFMALTYPDHDIVFHPQCYLRSRPFRRHRRAARRGVSRIANDPAFDAIWFARGGYGSNRILETVMPQLGAAAGRKTYIGFSDMGFLLGALYARRIGRSGAWRDGEQHRQERHGRGGRLGAGLADRQGPPRAGAEPVPTDAPPPRSTSRSSPR
jgi:hypothetical protein